MEVIKARELGFCMGVRRAVDMMEAASGELGHHSGSYVVKDATGAVVDSGNYLAVMQRQADGRWLMIRDTWNSDRPPPAPAAAAEEPPTG